MTEERRLVWRVLRYWEETAPGVDFTRCANIEPWIQGEDGANCLLIAVESPIELSHFLGWSNLASAMCRSDTLTGVLLSRVSEVVLSRRGLIVEGVATLREEGIRYRAVLLPLSEDGITIDHVLGAANYRSLHTNEPWTMQVNFHPFADGATKHR